MKTQHTLKPWKAVGGIVYDTKMRAISRAGCLADLEETDANARLIAAAPELLDALQIMVDAFNVKEIDPLVAFASIEKAKAAIQKAQ